MQMSRRRKKRDDGGDQAAAAAQAWLELEWGRGSTGEDGRKNTQVHIDRFGILINMAGVVEVF